MGIDPTGGPPGLGGAGQDLVMEGEFQPAAPGGPTALWTKGVNTLMRTSTGTGTTMRTSSGVPTDMNPEA